MSFNVKSDSSVKEVVTPGDRRGYTKLYGEVGSFWTNTFNLWYNIYNYSRIVVIGKQHDATDDLGRYTLNFDIIPGVTEFSASQTILHADNDMQHVLMIIKYYNYRIYRVTVRLLVFLSLIHAYV